jgi:hypothetical protein
MASFIYTVWFRDPDTDPSDQDHEWPACIRVTAETDEAALRWGDTLAKRRSQRLPLAIFLHSTAERETTQPGATPYDLQTVADGEDATIDW